MKRWLIRLVLSAVAFYLTSLVLNAIGAFFKPVTGDNIAQLIISPSDYFGRAALAILGLSLVNSLIRPVLGFLSLPLTLMTLGLWSLIMNAFLFYLVGVMTGGYMVKGGLAYIGGPIMLGFLTWVLSLVIRE